MAISCALGVKGTADAASLRIAIGRNTEYVPEAVEARAAGGWLSPRLDESQMRIANPGARRRSLSLMCRVLSALKVRSDDRYSGRARSESNCLKHTGQARAGQWEQRGGDWSCWENKLAQSSPTAPCLGWVWHPVYSRQPPVNASSGMRLQTRPA